MLRPSDVKVAHNKIVAQCRAVTDSSTLPLPEIIKQIEGLAKSAGTAIELKNVLSIRSTQIDCYLLELSRYHSTF